MQHLEGLRTLSFAALENQQQTSDQEGFEGGGKGLSRDDRREVGTHGGGGAFTVSARHTHRVPGGARDLGKEMRGVPTRRPTGQRAGLRRGEPTTLG